MSIITYAVTIFLWLGLALMGLSGCAGTDLKSQPQDVRAFFVAAKEAQYLALKCPTSGSVDLSAYSHLMEIKYPPTTQVDVLKQAPVRPYKTFAVLECQPAPHARTEEVLAGLKDKAKEIGADAIILCQALPDSGPARTPPPAILQAVAIRYVVTAPQDKGKHS
jgi:hypothetical protein